MISKTDLKRLPNATKLQLLQNHFHPHSSYSFQKTDMNGYKRSGLPLGGHRDDNNADPAANKGNFMELLSLHGGVGDSVLAHHLETCKKKARYSSKTIQNELVHIIGEQIKKTIVNEIKEAKFFSVLCDEVTDAANIEQVIIVFRFVDSSLRNSSSSSQLIEQSVNTSHALS